MRRRPAANETDSGWATGLSRTALPAEAIHIWRIKLVQPAQVIAHYSAILSSDETIRAAKFHFQRDRDRYVIAHGALRSLLGSYLKLDGSALHFQYSRHGKPQLADIGSELKFNLSHSGNFALLAISSKRNVGIDIEAIRPHFAVHEIAKRYFSLAEVAKFRDLPPRQRSGAFFDCWTRKEAYVKARGQGLSIPLDSFDVAFAPGEIPALLRTTPDQSDVFRWSLHALPAIAGYKAALAVEGQGRDLECWDWEPPARLFSAVLNSIEKKL
jgi:4'-phosphopantetheinyl transferase